jgi:hypothetical protein
MRDASGDAFDRRRAAGRHVDRRAVDAGDRQGIEDGEDIGDADQVAARAGPSTTGRGNATSSRP